MNIDNKPDAIGVYVAYVDPEYDIPWAEKRLLFWDGARWSYPGSDQRHRGKVYGCIGPLPSRKLIPGKME